MSDEEEVMSEEEASEEPAEEPEPEEEEKQEEAAPPPKRHSVVAPADDGPTEAELAMQRRRANQISSAGLDEAAKELLEANAQEREQMSQEIQELRERSERRKQERIEEEREIAARRAEEDARRKQEEEDRKRQKEEQERERREKRDEQMNEFAKLSNAGKPNFVVIKKSAELVGGAREGEEEEEKGEGKMSREQMEQERKAILSQRIQPLEIDGLDQAKLSDKAKSLHREILRLEGEKYDLEKRFKEQQYDMLEMAERARQINKVGKTGLKRVVLKDDERDTIQERYSGAPSKIELYSRFERQPDKRAYGEKHTVFTGPTYLFPAEKVKATKIVKWDENTGLPIYEEIPGAAPAEEAAAGEE